MILESTLRIEVIECFQHLKTCLNTLQHHIVVLDATLPAWFAPPNDFPILENASIREQVFAFIAQFEYLNHQNPKEILVGPGILGASIDTLSCIHDFNMAKNDFKKAMLKLKAHKANLGDAQFNTYFETVLEKRPEIQPTLSKLGLARLHLKQCYRRIPTFQQKPNKIAWTWANTRSIKRISVLEAQEKLIKLGSDIGIEQQLQKLSSLAPTENLAIVQTLAPHLRANVVLPTEQDATKRVMVKGPIPIFYLCTDNTLPDLRPPGIKQGRNPNRPIRKDVLLDPLPFLPAIRAHRYSVLEPA